MNERMGQVPLREDLDKTHTSIIVSLSPVLPRKGPEACYKVNCILGERKQSGIPGSIGYWF